MTREVFRRARYSGKVSGDLVYNFAENIEKLREVGATDVTDGVMVLVKEVNTIYAYHADSEAPDDGANIIKPHLVDVGRWLKISFAGQHAPGKGFADKWIDVTRIQPGEEVIVNKALSGDWPQEVVREQIEVDGLLDVQEGYVLVGQAHVHPGGGAGGGAGPAGPPGPAGADGADIVSLSLEENNTLTLITDNGQFQADLSSLEGEGVATNVPNGTRTGQILVWEQGLTELTVALASSFGGGDEAELGLTEVLDASEARIADTREAQAKITIAEGAASFVINYAPATTDDVVERLKRFYSPSSPYTSFGNFYFLYQETGDAQNPKVLVTNGTENSPDKLVVNNQEIDPLEIIISPTNPPTVDEVVAAINAVANQDNTKATYTAQTLAGGGQAWDTNRDASLANGAPLFTGSALAAVENNQNKWLVGDHRLENYDNKYTDWFSGNLEGTFVSTERKPRVWDRSYNRDGVRETIRFSPFILEPTTYGNSAAGQPSQYTYLEVRRITELGLDNPLTIEFLNADTQGINFDDGAQVASQWLNDTKTLRLLIRPDITTIGDIGQHFLDAEQEEVLGLTTFFSDYEVVIYVAELNDEGQLLDSRSIEGPAEINNSAYDWVFDADGFTYANGEVIDWHNKSITSSTYPFGIAEVKSGLANEFAANDSAYFADGRQVKNVANAYLQAYYSGQDVAGLPLGYTGWRTLTPWAPNLRLYWMGEPFNTWTFVDNAQSADTLNPVINIVQNIGGGGQSSNFSTQYDGPHDIQEGRNPNNPIFTAMTVDSGLSYIGGEYITIQSDANPEYVQVGIVVDYVDNEDGTGSLTYNHVRATGGDHGYSGSEVWNINLSGAPGDQGLDGDGQAFVDIDVTVANGKFLIDGHAYSTNTGFSLARGLKYRFNQSDPSNLNHPLRFSTISDGPHNGNLALASDVGSTFGYAWVFRDTNAGNGFITQAEYDALVENSSIITDGSGTEWIVRYKYTTLTFAGSVTNYVVYTENVNAPNTQIDYTNATWPGGPGAVTAFSYQDVGYYDFDKNTGMTQEAFDDALANADLPSYHGGELLDVGNFGTHRLLRKQDLGSKFRFWVKRNNGSYFTAADLPVSVSWPGSEADAQNGLIAFEDGVTVTGTAGEAGASVMLETEFSEQPRKIHYYCENHSGMGAYIVLNIAAELANLAASIEEVDASFQSDFVDLEANLNTAEQNIAQQTARIDEIVATDNAQQTQIDNLAAAAGLTNPLVSDLDVGDFKIESTSDRDLTLLSDSGRVNVDFAGDSFEANRLLQVNGEVRAYEYSFGMGASNFGIPKYGLNEINDTLFRADQRFGNDSSVLQAYHGTSSAFYDGTSSGWNPGNPNSSLGNEVAEENKVPITDTTDWRFRTIFYSQGHADALSDLTFDDSGYTGDRKKFIRYRIRIISAATYDENGQLLTPDEWAWDKYELGRDAALGASQPIASGGVNIPMTAGDQAVTLDGITINFASNTGHRVTSFWYIHPRCTGLPYALYDGDNETRLDLEPGETHTFVTVLANYQDFPGSGVSYTQGNMFLSFYYNWSNFNSIKVWGLYSGKNSLDRGIWKEWDSEITSWQNYRNISNYQDIREYAVMRVNSPARLYMRAIKLEVTAGLPRQAWLDQGYSLPFDQNKVINDSWDREVTSLLTVNMHFDRMYASNTETAYVDKYRPTNTITGRLLFPDRYKRQYSTYVESSPPIAFSSNRLAGLSYDSSSDTLIVEHTNHNALEINSSGMITRIGPASANVNDVLTWDGASWGPAAVGAGGGGGSAASAEPSFTTKQADFDCDAGSRYLVNTDNGAVTALLPINPAQGEAIYFVDATGNFGTNSLTIDRNTNTIMGLNEDMTVTVSNESFGLVYTGSDWRIYR